LNPLTQFSFKRRSHPIYSARGVQQVKLEQSSLTGGANRFQTTRWSVVLISAQGHAPGSKEAFANLCKLYWYPLYAFIRHRGNSPEDAEDLVQGFFLHLVEHRTLSRVDLSKGKFPAKRMGAKTIELKASHLSLISHPQEITDLILEAATGAK
jgi:hypothetical protein